jgi:hypothetical protein
MRAILTLLRLRQSIGVLTHPVFAALDHPLFTCGVKRVKKAYLNCKHSLIVFSAACKSFNI